MLQIEAIRAVIHTNDGAFGRTIMLGKGLNIIRANNTSGKSSFFGAILYGLGFEELLGGRNEKALQSVFKSVVKEIVSDGTNTESEHRVIQSEIYLQFSNGKDVVTTRRFALHEKIKAQAIEVFFGPLITSANEELRRQGMYLHDKGSASNEDIGFHRFLEEFSGAVLPEVVNQDGRKVKLYLPLIAAAHFIEQKAGWSDFFANLPYNGIRDANSKVFEYILDLDVFSKALKRQEIQNHLKQISDRWSVILNKIEILSKRGGAEAVGIPLSPEILTKENKPYLRFLRADKSLLLSELINSINRDLQEVMSQINVPLSQNLDKIEDDLSTVKGHIERYELLYENLGSQVSQDRERLRQYLTQLKNVDEDLRKNKDAEKLQKIGLEANLSIDRGICPTCGQAINDTLLNEHLHIKPMRIDENISFLQAQRKMIEAFIQNLREQIREKDIKISSLETSIQRNRSIARSLKKSLIADDRLPSEEIIERKLNLEKEQNFIYRLREEFEQLVSELYKISTEYNSVRSSGAALGGDYLSSNDLSKIESFESYFKSLLERFGFTSKPVNTIKISPEKYLPVYELSLNNGIKRQVDIRFESSASDFIRAQWAYYTSLMKISTEYAGNHFRLLVFDEPQQQSAANQNFKVFLKELENFQNEQTIVFASFQNSNDDFREATNGLLKAHIIDLASNSELFITRINS